MTGSGAGIGDVGYDDLGALWRDIEPSLAGLQSLEAVAAPEVAQ